MDTLWDWIAARAGRLIPCSLCRTPTDPNDLTETQVPGYYIAEWDVTVMRLVWLCPTCPR